MEYCRESWGKNKLKRIQTVGRSTRSRASRCTDVTLDELVSAALAKETPISNQIMTNRLSEEIDGLGGVGIGVANGDE